MKLLYALLLLLTPGPARAAVTGGLNVVVVMMETLRPDHLGCYGYGRPTSPNIDGLAAEGVLFENAFAQSSQSLISAASVLTGLYPPSHGVARADQSLDPSLPTLAGELKARGYKTAAFTAGFFLNRGFGLDSGFETYDDSRDFGTLADVLPAALKWLKRNDKEKFFLLVHGYDAHAPYRAPKRWLKKFAAPYAGPLSGVKLDYDLADRVWKDAVYEDYRLQKRVAPFGKADLDYIEARYDGAVAYADAQVGKLLKRLDSRGLRENTVVIFLATAGEALMEHGTVISSFHGGLYDEGIRVPLVVRAPGAAPARVKTAVQLVDLLPTVADLLGFPAPPSAQGASLRPALEGREQPERTVFAQTLSLKDSSPYVGIRRYPWKLLLEDGGYELFDLAADPGETRNAAGSAPYALKTMTEELDRLLAAMPRPKPAAPRRPLAAVAERMKKLGYWWMERPRVEHWSELGRGKEQPPPAK